MATTGQNIDAMNGDSSNKDFETVTRGMTHEEKTAAQHAARFGYGPLAHMRTDAGAALPGEFILVPKRRQLLKIFVTAFGGEFQPGLYKPVEGRKFANPAPLGLCAFALTTFVLSLINLGTRGVKENALIISLAFGYGGLVQLLAGMWYVLFVPHIDSTPC